MSGVIMIVDTPYAVQTDASGHATITGVPAGAATVRVWHPSIRNGANSLAQPAMIPAAGFATTYTIRR